MSSFRISILADGKNTQGFTVEDIFYSAINFLYNEIDKYQLDIEHFDENDIDCGIFKFAKAFNTFYGQIRFESETELQLRQIIHEICEYRSFDSRLTRDNNGSYQLVVYDSLLDICVARVNVYFVESIIKENKPEILDIFSVTEHKNTSISTHEPKPNRTNNDIEMLFDVGRALGAVIDSMNLKDIDDPELSAMGLEGKRMIQAGLMLIKKSLYKDKSFC